MAEYSTRETGQQIVKYTPVPHWKNYDFKQKTVLILKMRLSMSILLWTNLSGIYNHIELEGGSVSQQSNR